MAIFQWDGFWEVGGNARNDLVFEVLWVHEGKRVVVLEHQDRVALAPDTKHGAVHNVGKRALRIVSNRLSKYVIGGSSSKEVTTSASKACKLASLSDSSVNVVVPELVGWEGSEVAGLEGFDDGDRQASLRGQRLRPASIIAAVSELFAHKSI